MHLMNVTNQIPIFIVMAVYTATYAVFAIIAYNHSKEQLNIRYKFILIEFVLFNL